MGDVYGRRAAVDEAERKATEGDKPKEDHCAAAEAKVARQKPGSAMEKLAKRQLAACRERQSTDSQN